MLLLGVDKVQSWPFNYRNSSPKNENLLKMFLPSGHPRCRLVWLDLEIFG